MLKKRLTKAVLLILTILFSVIAAPSAEIYTNATNYSATVIKNSVNQPKTIYSNGNAPQTRTYNLRWLNIGSLLIIFLINILFFFSLRDKSYLFFSIYIALNLLFLFSKIQTWQYFEKSSIFLSYLFFSLLTCKLLDIKNLNKSLSVFFQKFSLIYWLPAIGIFFLSESSKNLFVINLSVSLIFSISIIYISAKAYKQKLNFAKHILIAAILFFAEDVFILVEELLNFEHSYYYIYKISSYLSILIIAYSLLINFINKLKDSQQQIIFNLEEINTIKDDANIKLDEKVKLRTKELQEANIQLNNKNKDIEVIVKNLEDANEQNLEQKELIEETHLKLTESINSASHIQKAMLPRDTIFKTLFKEFFIFYKPKDVVSGDFYWIKNINNKVILAAADCTGHGVPGAFVSMLGISQLNEIVRKKPNISAGSILDELRTALKISLRQEGHENEIKEGIDMVLCILDLNNYEMEMAGANNSMYIIREDTLKSPEESKKVRINEKVKVENTNLQLIELKGNHQPIGVYRRERPFDSRKIKLFPNDVLYLFSDGYVDQFGGKKGYKYRTKPFKNFLISIQKHSLEQQKHLLDKNFNDWKGTHRQLDDVMLMGLKL